jgi:predicted ATP-grasp superfamily ATP-dependent carboligase
MNDVRGTSALITDVERRKALPIIRALGRAGVRLIGISYQNRPFGQYSKYLHDVRRCPDYRSNPGGFLDFLEDLCRREQPDVFYPLEDVILELCVTHPARWAPWTRALLPDAAALAQAYDKWQTIQVAKRCGIAVPRTLCPETAGELEPLLGERTEWVIKPRKSSGSRGLVYVSDPRQLIGSWQQVAREYPRPLVQERIPWQGQGVGAFFLLDRDRRELARFGHKRLREYPVSGGPSTLRMSFHDDALLAQSLRLVREIGCVGVSMVEYKIDPRNGRYVLMEVNPRFWGSLALPVYCGVNFPLLYHQACLGIAFEPVLDFPAGRYCRWLLPGDILHFLKNPDRLHLQPSFFHFFDRNMTDDIISLDDPWPTLGILLEGVRKLRGEGR